MPLEIEPGISGEGAEALRKVPGVIAPVHAAGDVVVDPRRRSGPTSCSAAAAASAPSAVIRESVLWERVSVGAGALVEGAIVASGAIIGPRRTSPPGSVIGHDVTIEPGRASCNQAPRFESRPKATAGQTGRGKARLARERPVYPASNAG